VEKELERWETDCNNILSRQELKVWLKEEIAHTPEYQKVISDSFQGMVSDADAKKDGIIDILELYQYCVKNYVLDSELK
jgi:hypothetical protein